ncbi:ALK and LTK ligand 2 isoform 1-T2 [Leptodactylus fuscus]|uniref:ALK and LTK ligand 2 n=1 Tax=Leptodactylus fuscus TaxID=238119 RepID=UPI003F4F339C
MRNIMGSALLVILLILLSPGYCKCRTDSRNLTDKNLLNFFITIIKDFKRYHNVEDNSAQYPSKQDYYPEDKEDVEYGAYQEQRVEIVPRDLRMKEKFLKHLTGRLSFKSPTCNKHFRRLYNSTRDCTIQANYKRCARLLTRLAVSPICMDG